jgi:hypothetical protein
MSDDRKWPVMAWHRGALIAWLALVHRAWAVCVGSCRGTGNVAGQGVTRVARVLYHSALSRFLAAHMAETGIADWRFAPATCDAVAADRVEWSFKLNPYAGGEVRSFVRPHMADRTFAAHRPITIEARLYLNGEYQTLVKKQAVIQGGPDDPDLAAEVASVTQNLLGPQGAFRAIDTGGAPAQGPR